MIARTACADAAAASRGFCARYPKRIPESFFWWRCGGYDVDLFDREAFIKASRLIGGKDEARTVTPRCDTTGFLVLVAPGRALRCAGRSYVGTWVYPPPVYRPNQAYQTGCADG